MKLFIINIQIVESNQKYIGFLDHHPWITISCSGYVFMCLVLKVKCLACIEGLLFYCRIAVLKETCSFLSSAFVTDTY